MTTLILSILTWLELTAFAFCISIVVFRLPVFETRRALAFRSHSPAVTLVPVFYLSLAVIAAASAAEPGFPAADMNGSVMLRGCPWSPPMVRIATLLALAILAAAEKHSRNGGLLKYLMLAITMILGWTFSASGHASVQGHFSMTQNMDLVHLVASAQWGGGVLVLALIILPPLVRRGNMDAIAEVSRMFIKVTTPAVVLVLLTALYNMKIYAGSFEALWRTSYGLVMSAKVFLFYLLLLVGAFNRYVAVPVLEHVAGTRVDGPGLPGRVIGALFAGFRYYLGGPVTLLFRKALLIEALLMVGLLVCSSVLKHQIPPAFEKRKDHKQVEQSRQEPQWEVPSGEWSRVRRSYADAYFLAERTVRA